MKNKLSHLDERARPRMVDVSEKSPSKREAVAEALVRFPEESWKSLAENNFASKKGPILDVARVAGTMGVKRTADLIPFCHPIPIEGCAFEMDPLPEACSIRIRCRVTTTGRTGVEMEALTGASIAALTLYDMTKSLGHGAVVESTRLLSKSGGKSDFQA